MDGDLRPLVTDQSFDLVRVPALDQQHVVRRPGGETDRGATTGRIHDEDAVTAIKAALDAPHTGRQQALAVLQRRDGAFVDALSLARIRPG